MKSNILEQTLEQTKVKKSIVEVFGLGYVGFPLTVLLANNGFNVIGVDTDSKKVERLKRKELSDSEINSKEKFLDAIDKNLSITIKSQQNKNFRIGIICVPTPIPTKKIESSVYVKSAVINFLDNSKKGDIIILESSIEIGTTKQISDIIESYGYSTGEDFGLAFCPERIDPQNKKWHLENIPRIVYCSDEINFKIIEEIYQYINGANFTKVETPETAELVKSFENSFRLVNISLVNELAILCEKLNLNVNEVVNAATTKPFGFMPFYPSAGAGGHCIPKDPKLLLKSAEKNGVNFFSIKHALEINAYVPKHISNSILKELEKQKLEKIVLVCGLTYKPDIEDMRDSPGFKIIKELYQKKCSVLAFDPFYKKKYSKRYIDENRLEGINFEWIDNLEKKSLEKINCICIVQQHTKMKSMLEYIYKNSTVPLIFDCQNNLKVNSNSKTILKSFGRN